jgi:hypothetical protein
LAGVSCLDASRGNWPVAGLAKRTSGEAPEPFLAVFNRVLPSYEQQAAKLETEVPSKPGRGE